MLKVSRRNLRFLTYVTLFVAACSFGIGVSLSFNHQNKQQVYPNNPALTGQSSLTTTGLTGAPGVPGQTQLNLQPQVAEKKDEIENLKPQVFETPAKFQGKTLKQLNVAPTNKVIALTFDDGPWPKYSQQILEILKKNDIKATFFWIGRNVENFPEIAKQVVAEGHAIGNHTWSHSYRRMSQANAAAEIDKTADIIEKTTNVKTTLFRPPGGILSNGPAGYAMSKNYSVLMWSSDSTDYARGLSVKTMVNKVLKNSDPGGMILMHDGGGDRARTVQALPIIISSLKKQGYKFVTVPTLLTMEEIKKETKTKKKSNQEKELLEKEEEKETKAQGETSQSPSLTGGLEEVPVPSPSQSPVPSRRSLAY